MCIGIQMVWLNIASPGSKGNTFQHRIYRISHMTPININGRYQGIPHVLSCKCNPSACWRDISSIYRPSGSYCHASAWKVSCPNNVSIETDGLSVLLTLPFALEPPSELLKMEIPGPHFRNSTLVSLRQGPGTFIFSTPKVILSLLTFDYSFDYKTANVSLISLFSGLNVIKYVRNWPQFGNCVFLLPPFPLTKK